MSLIVKDGQNQNQTLKTIVAGTGQVSYHNEEADFFLRVSRGNESGLEVVHVWGENPATTIGGVGTEAEVWWPGGRLVYPAAATIMNVSSSSTNDTSAGTGVRTVLVKGLLVGFTEATETVTMNGTSLVATSNSFLRINSVEAVTAGTTGHNEGLITVQTSGSPSDIIAEMPIARNRAMNTHYTVPVGKEAFIRTMFGSAQAGVSMRYTLLMRDGVTADAVFVPMTMLDVTAEYKQREFALFEAKVFSTNDIVIRADRVDTSGASAAVAGFSALLVSVTEIIG